VDFWPLSHYEKERDKHFGFLGFFFGIAGIVVFLAALLDEDLTTIRRVIDSVVCLPMFVVGLRWLDGNVHSGIYDWMVKKSSANSSER
jgi:hypothetical protein